MSLLDDDTVSNSSDNTTFQEILHARFSRRTAMIGGLAAAATTFFAAGSVNALGAPAAAPAPTGRPGSGRTPLFSFTSIANDAGVMPTIAPEYQYDVLIPWWTRLDGGPDDFADHFEAAGLLKSASTIADEQTRRIGIGHDGMWYFGDERRGMLCINHEFGTNPHILRTTNPSSLDEVRIVQHAHGVSVVQIERTRSGWQVRNDRRNRRIHVNTPVTFSGPVAGSAPLQTPAANPPLGTLNNCANGYTPWGTYLTCEENFNGYFGRRSGGTNTEEQGRYGFSPGGFGYGWHLFDDRFDLSNAQYRNEENRFGWVVEIDPDRPNRPPVKRTALGRFKHEGATFVTGRGGRAVVYMGDDERFEYIYKFVSSGNWRSMQARGISPLDDGKLYVAKFNADGTGEWLELTRDNPALAARFATDAEMLTYTRIAGDLLGATKMDRPEWIAEGVDDEMFCTLTNNTRRSNPAGTPAGEVAANPLAPNPDGHIIRWVDADQHVGTTFVWDIFLISVDTEDGDGQMYGSPDGLWADSAGRVFIQTDGTQPVIELSGGVTVNANDQMLVADPVTEEVRRLLTGVRGCEVTGIAITPSQRVMFANLQHPGDGDPSLTSFPKPFDGTTIPRDATLVITRKDGGIVGS
ncbi:MAG: PhoX family phosphatase [Ilumatobacteraceae bacterium]|nr:PhoX family phosphatase [Ilumatobacteraceae bacterium]